PAASTRRVVADRCGSRAIIQPHSTIDAGTPDAKGRRRRLSKPGALRINAAGLCAQLHRAVGRRGIAVRRSRTRLGNALVASAYESGCAHRTVRYSVRVAVCFVGAADVRVLLCAPNKNEDECENAHDQVIDLQPQRLLSTITDLILAENKKGRRNRPFSSF